MSCPGIDELVAGGAAAEHARSCDDCRAVLEVVAARAPAGCGLAEALMAAQATGEIAPESERLLALHLGNCASCALVAGSLDAPAMADALASAVDLERSFDDQRAASERSFAESRAADDRSAPERRFAAPPASVERATGAGARVDRGPISASAAGDRRERTDGGSRRPDREPVRRRRDVAVAVIALLAIAVIAALVTRALG